MKKIAGILLGFVLIIVFVSFFSCGSSSKKIDVTTYYHLDKKYWDENDYEDVINKIKINAPDDQKYLGLSDPETAPVFKKLVDKENISIVAEDNTLGLQHREKYIEAMVGHSRIISDMYSALNREDKYIYPNEYVFAWKFFLWVDYYSVKIINEKMKKESDATNASEVATQCKYNMDVIIKNYDIYLDLANKESAFTSDALKLFAEGIDECFPKVINDFPDADYSEMLGKVNALLEKVNSSDIKKSLENLKSKIEEKLEQRKNAAEKK
jgi:hypothetical protein